MNTITILTILFAHWVADFVFQDEKWALGKSKNWGDLLKHTYTYSFVVSFMVMFIYLFGEPMPHSPWFSVKFMLITFISHTITDYFTSRIVSKKFENKHFGSPIPNFGAFSIIGIDQWLHYVQLYLTYEFLK